MTQEVLKKLRFTPQAIIFNAPKEIEKSAKQLGLKNILPTSAIQEILVFANNQQEVLYFLESHLPKIASDAMFWIAYPKKNSGIKTDINRDSFFTLPTPYGLRIVSNVAIDEIWSALRLRPIALVKTKN